MNGNSMLALLRVVFYLFAGAVFVAGFVFSLALKEVAGPILLTTAAAVLVLLFLGAVCGAVDQMRSSLINIHATIALARHAPSSVALVE